MTDAIVPTPAREPPRGHRPHDGTSPAGGLARRVWHLASPYFASEERWRARLLLASIIALTLLQIGLQVRFNLWNADFFNALESRDKDAFYRQLGMFALLATASMAVTVYQLYLKQVLQLRWRRWLTGQLTRRWLADGLHYQLAFFAADIDNPDQRIAEDVRVVTEAALDFLIGMVNSGLMFVCFIGILWSLSGSLPVTLFGHDVQIHGYMVWFALAYAVVGSGLTWAFGRPMIRVNAERVAHEADFRFGLIRIREKSEEIAFYRGEEDERRGLDVSFDTLAGTVRRLMGLQRRLTWLTSGYTLGAMVFPALIAAPRYFAGAITLGGLMQTTQAFNQVQGALSWFVENWPRLAEWRASVDRLLAFTEGLEDVTADVGLRDEDTIMIVEGPDDRLAIRDLEIAHADGTVVIARANATVAQGEKVLIVGESGSGKSTLFRAIAGLWPWGRGEIATPPADGVMFLPQRPYLPLGPLRATLAYPAPPDRFDDAALRGVLDRVGLGHLAGRLDESERWDRVLSGGEQQRLAFARMFLNRPRWIFMDEATSALDDAGQDTLMAMVAEQLPDATLLSIGHRAGLDRFHDRTLTLVAAPEGARLVSSRYERRRQASRAAPARKSRRGLTLRIGRLLRKRQA